jgi:hypothetical protein
LEALVAKLIATLLFILASGSAFATTSSGKIIAAANDSAASFLIDGKIDAQLARAFEVLNMSGLNTNEEKAVAILEANRSENK